MTIREIIEKHERKLRELIEKHERKLKCQEKKS